jgi:hypothetical protein
MDEIVLSRALAGATAEMLSNDIFLFPNPASERVFIQSAENIEISKAVGL